MSEIVLDLQRQPVSELVPRYTELFGKPPRNKNRVWLWRRIAWEEQARRYGGLSVAAKRRIAELQRELQLPEPTVRAKPVTIRSEDPPMGTRLEREWRGQTIVAVRVEAGWEIDGVSHTSLSAAAKAVTGTHRSGRAFFGLAPGSRGR